MTKTEALKKILELAMELEKVEGFGAIVEIHEMEGVLQEYTDQQTKEQTEEVSKLENTIRVQGNVILKLTDAERIIEKQRKLFDILKGQNEGLEDALSLLTDSNNYVKTKLEEANREVERLSDYIINTNK